MKDPALLARRRHRPHGRVSTGALMRRVFLIWLGVMLLALGNAAQAHAQSACDKPRDDFDGVYCMSKLYQQADSDLNSNYAKLFQKLNGPRQQLLRQSQLDWLNSRNQQCGRREGAKFYVNLACATQTTLARNRFLEDRYRECISTGCLDSKLSAPE